jgi:eukaryotic translation initiation factor 2-alpha kinase 3
MFNYEDFRKKVLEDGRYENQFDDMDVLGKGGFGIVMKAKHKLEGTIYAVKRIRVHLAIKGD